MGFIANNTVLTNFAGIGHLEVLQRMFGTLQIAEEVRLEVLDGVEVGYLHQESTLDATRGKDAWIGVVSMNESEREDFDGYYSGLTFFVSVLQ